MNMNVTQVTSWSLVVLLLFITSFGFSTFVYIIAGIMMLAAGVIAGIKSHSDDMIQKRKGSCLQHLQSADFMTLVENAASWKLVHDPLIPGDRKDSFCTNGNSKQLTGYPEIDHELDHVIRLLIKHHVKSWYKGYISNDTDFLKDVDSLIRSCIRVISCKIRMIDKVSYFTTKLVDDFASHIRLYRLSIEKKTELSIEDPDADLISLFFDLELQMECRKICRDLVSNSDPAFDQYVTHLVDVVMFLVLPLECFNNRPIRILLRTILVNVILHPLVDLFSDPDHINQLIIWSCQKLSSSSAQNPNPNSTPSASQLSGLSTESFLTIIRLSESMDELSCIQDLVQQELTLLRSRDTGGEDDFEIKQQINSLIFLENLITSRCEKLTEGQDNTMSPNDANELLMKNFSGKLIKLPFEVVIKNNVALSHFIEFMSSIGSQGYVFFYLNVEGFRVSAEQVVSTTDPIVTPDLEFLRPTAVNIYETYLSPDKYSSQKLELEDALVKRIAHRLKSDPIGEDLFDESFNQCFIIMRDRETFYPAFQKSLGYIRMLQDLDLFRDVKTDEGTTDDTGSVPEYIEFDNLSISSGSGASGSSGSTTKPWISIEIDSTGVVREFGTAHAVYAITVSVRKENGTIDRWCSLRRYSDFFTFHANTIDKFPILSRLQLPAKRTLSNNLSQEFLEQRKHLLNSYLQQVIRILINRKDLPGFRDHVLKFLEPGAYNEKEKASQMIGKAVDKLVLNPFKSMGDAMRAGSDNLRDRFVKLQGSLQSMSASSTTSSSSHSSMSRSNSLLVPGMMPPGVPSNDSRSHHLRHSVSTASLSSIGSQVTDSTKVAAQIDLDTEDNIPLRIMLLLLDEVFDLKSKNQWLRRRIVAVIQQIINAFSGDLLSKKIIDYVQDLTSSTATAGYIRILRKKFWPNCVPAADAPVRSESVKRVTAVIAKSYLISCMSDDLKHMIGSETTRRGLLRVFDMFQNTTLNRRLVIVLMEGLLLQLFPENNFDQIFMKLHSCSTRVDPSELPFNASTNNSNWPPYLAKFLSSSEPLKDTFKSPSSFYTPSNRSCSPVPSVSSRGSTRGSPVHQNQSSHRRK